VPTNISNVFSHYLVRTRSAYQHFQCFQSLSAKILVCLPIFLVCSVIICKDPGVLPTFYNVFSHYFQRSRCAYQNFQCLQSLFPKIQVCLPKFPMSSVIICKDPSVPTNISNVFSHYFQRSRCAYQNFQCLQSLSAKILVCLPTFPMSSVIICKDPGVPTNISNVFSHYLLRTRCAYQHFHRFQSLSAKIQVCLPTFPMSSVIICKDPGVPTNILNVFSHYFQRSRCAYQNFYCFQSLSAKILVCLPIFPMSSVIICKDPGVPTNISNAFIHYLQRSKCAYQHFQCLRSLSAKILVCLPTFLVCSVIISKDLGVPTNISTVFYHYLMRSRCAYQHLQCL